MKNRRNATIALVAVASLGLAACGSSAASTAAGKAGPKKVIALLPQEYDQPYGAVYVDTMKKTATKLGITLELQNSKYDAATQASQCNVAIAEKPNAIILWPADATAVSPCLLKAKAAGIPVNSSNSDVVAANKNLVHTYSGPSNDQVGRLDADMLNDALKGKGNVIIIEGQPGNSTATDRLTGFRNQLATKYPNIKVLGMQPANWDKALAITATSELLTRFGSQVNGIYAQDDTMASGAVEAIKSRGINPSTIAIVGCGNTKLGQANVLSGAQYGTLFQSPVWDGSNALDLINKVMLGQKTPTNVFMPMPEVTKVNASKYQPEW